MEAYRNLAHKYDALTGDVPYKDFISLYKKEFSRKGGEFRLLLDLCCGTGTMTKLLLDEGYDMIAVDSSNEMLMEARKKCGDILLLCQEATRLDLYGTVDAALSSLDSMNYIPPKDFPKVLKRLHYFIRPEGMFIFDIRPEQWLKEMDKTTSVDETEDTLCLWRGDYNKKKDALEYGIDLFIATEDGKWERSFEEHVEYAYSLDFLQKSLKDGGYGEVRIIEKTDRIFISCVRK